MPPYGAPGPSRRRTVQPFDGACVPVAERLRNWQAPHQSRCASGGRKGLDRRALEDVQVCVTDRSGGAGRSIMWMVLVVRWPG